jgi:2-dehydropantoate 2-reductase
MRILVVGAGAVGGYFGGRLLEAGRDVTFLVRPRRAAELARIGLVIRSQHGDVEIPAPPTVTAETLRGPIDLILVSCKAYDLNGAADSFAPAVGSKTAILPLLNGMRHLDDLDARFGAGHVLGGQCVISSVLDEAGRIIHLNEAHSLSFGERDGSRPARVEAIASDMSGARFESRLSQAILQEMWEKWVFIATGAGITCLMRATVGDIVAAGAADFVTALLDECAAIAAAQGYPPGPSLMQRSRAIFTKPRSELTASMFRDIERRAPIEADHIIGDLLRRGHLAGAAGEQANSSPLLRIVYAHLKAYEARREREVSRGAAVDGGSAQ